MRDLQRCARPFFVGKAMIGVCCLLVAGTAYSVPIDVSFGFGSSLNTSSPAMSGSNGWGQIYDAGTTTNAGVGNIGWSQTSSKISLDGVSFGSSTTKGFYQDQVFSAPNGKVVYEPNTTQHTFGSGSATLPNSPGLNSASFHNQHGNGDLGQDTTGVVGFRSSEGNWGYVEFDWVESTSSMNVLSAQVETIANTPITFDPGGGGGGGVPGSDGSIPVSFGFGSSLNTSSPAMSGSNGWGQIYDAGTTTNAGVGNIGWSQTSSKISLDGVSFGSSTTKGFYQDQVFSAPNGKVVYEPNTTQHTFGSGSATLPNSPGLNSASFHNQHGNGDLGQDTTGVVGFRSSEGNWGYVEFDWVESTSSMNVLSARVQPTANTPITFFTGGGGGGGGGPGYADGTLDVSFGFGNTLNVNSPSAASQGYGTILTTDVLGNTVPAGVGNLVWNATADDVSLTGIQGSDVATGLSPQSGVFHESQYGSSNGLIEYVSNTSAHTFGGSGNLLPSTGLNKGSLHSIFSGGDLGQDVNGGVFGFRSSAGNWGYIEFDWNEATSTMTVLSAKVQRQAGLAITFNASASSSGVLLGGGAVPEPGSLLLLTLGATMACLRRCRRCEEWNATESNLIPTRRKQSMQSFTTASAIALVSLLWVPVLSAATLNLTPQDNWKHILNGAGFLQPGDELVFGAGTYDAGGSSLRIKYRGTAANPITIRAADGANVHFTRPNASFNMFDLEGAQHLTIKGLEITGGSTAIRIGNDGAIPSKFITLDGNHIHDTFGQGVAANFANATYEGMHFKNNHIHNTGAEGEAFYLGCNDNACQFFDGIIENNYIHDLVDDGNPSFDYQGDGIELKLGSYNNIIRDNVIVNTAFPAVTVYGVEGQGARNIIERNVMWDIQNHGIQSASDAIVRNNLILGATIDGVHIQKHQAALPGNLDVVNNTIYANVGNTETGFSVVHNGIRINPENGFSGPILLANNAIYVDGNGDAIRMYQPPSNHPVTSINNVGDEGPLWTTTVVPFDASGNLTSDFVDFLNLDAFPKAGGKLIGAGNATYQPLDDFNETARAGSNDVGAYRYNASGNPGWDVVPGFKGFPAGGGPGSVGGLPGDYDGNGVVEVADLGTWRQQYGQLIAAGTGADGSGNGLVDAADFTVWRDLYEASLNTSNSAAVPEPATMLTLLAALGMALCKRRVA